MTLSFDNGVISESSSWLVIHTSDHYMFLCHVQLLLTFSYALQQFNTTSINDQILRQQMQLFRYLASGCGICIRNVMSKFYTYSYGS